MGLGDRDCTDRLPPLRVSADSETPVLWISDADQFLSRLGGRGRRRTMTALSTASPQQLATLNGVIFHHKMRAIRWVYPAVSDTRAALAGGAFEDQLIDLVVEGIGPRKRLTAGGVVREGEAPEDATWLILDPLALELDQAQAAAVPRDAAGHNLVFLPPRAAVVPTNSYFDPELDTLRDAFLAAVAPNCGQAAFISLQRLTADPLVRSLLLEGGQLTIAVGPDKQTALAIELWDDPETSTVPATLSSWILAPSSLGGRPWMAELARCLRSRLEGLADGRLVIERASRRGNWRIPDLPDYDLGGPLVGAWQLLERVAKALDPPRREAFSARILRPSRGLNGHAADQDLAMRTFLACLARCPWTNETSAHSEAGPWRRAWLDALSGHLARREDRGRLLRHAAKGGWSRLTDGSAPRAAELVLPATADDAAMLYARLVLPVGAVVRRDDAPRLNLGARLNGLSRLAGSVTDTEPTASTKFIARLPIVPIQKLTVEFAKSIPPPRQRPDDAGRRRRLGASTSPRSGAPP